MAKDFGSLYHKYQHIEATPFSRDGIQQICQKIDNFHIPSRVALSVLHENYFVK